MCCRSVTCTDRRYGRGTGVGRGRGLGPALGVIVGLGVTVAVGVMAGVGDGVAVGVTLGVGLAVGEGVAVGVGAPCTSKAPLSMRPFTTRLKPGPRWSKKGGGVKFGSPESIAGLPGNNACVKVGPPLSCNGLNIGSVLTWSPGPVRKPAPSSLLRLYPVDVTVPPKEWMFAGWPLFKTVFPI